MLRIGLVGLGFMGKMHFETYNRLPKAAKIVAVCDKDKKKRAGDWSAIGGNIATGAAKRVDFGGAKVYDDWKKFVRDPDLDVVDITLPTDLHAAVTVAALKAGKHVICEKPMARTALEAKKMVAAAKAAKRQLYVGQCIRFWPAYVKTRELVQGGKLGKVRSATFRRLSSLPVWSSDNWLLDNKRGGGAALDLHIHDADFVQYLFGKPKTVTAWTASLAKGRPDHVVTRYGYAGDMLVTAEGAWLYEGTFPFSMTFNVKADKGTLMLGADGKLTLHGPRGAKEIAVDAESGYYHELVHYLDCIRKGKRSPFLTADSAAASVALIEAEMKSAKTGKTVLFK